MAKIEQLTPEEEALIPIVRDEWLKIGLATGPTNREAAQAAIADAYRMAGLEPPKLWIWLGSPYAGCIGSALLTTMPVARKLAGRGVIDPVQDKILDKVWNEVQRQMGDKARSQVQRKVLHEVWSAVQVEVQAPVIANLENQAPPRLRELVWDQLENQMQVQLGSQVQIGELGKQCGKAGCGPHYAGPFSLFDFFRRIKRVAGPERLEPLIRLAAVAGWWWPFECACIIAERPAVLHRDEAGRLHLENGPALAYPDGWAIHAWHGLNIPSWLVEEKHRITPDVIKAEGNAKLRRVMLEILASTNTSKRAVPG